MKSLIGENIILIVLLESKAKAKKKGGKHVSIKQVQGIWTDVDYL
jgi:hypothetical protein